MARKPRRDEAEGGDDPGVALRGYDIARELNEDGSREQREDHTRKIKNPLTLAHPGSLPAEKGPKMEVASRGRKQWHGDCSVLPNRAAGNPGGFVPRQKRRSRRRGQVK